MRAIMVMYDSLNRRLLQPYGCDWTKTPNFLRLAQRTVTFDNFYVGSLPCMPARRDLHTGRYSFLHRSWGPLEPFDNSMPKMLHQSGVYTHLISDHDHYWEDGGATYHTQYTTWRCVRGQEADASSNVVSEPYVPAHVPTMREFTHPEWWRHSWHNKAEIHSTNKWPQDDVFDQGLDFLERNKNEDNWFLHIETFDPHEPFDSPQEYRSLYPDDYDGDHFDWPPYAPVSETDEQVKHIRKRYASLLSMCDKNLGRILDFMDRHQMWEDTMLIVNTDHGFMLGEKDWWAKSVMPCYNEIAHTPFFLWDPRSPEQGGTRSNVLAQTIDIPATLLEYFDVSLPREMQGMPLRHLMDGSKKRDYALFGFHGSFVNITDGQHLYMRAASSISNQPLNEYTLMPTHQQGFFTAEELKDTTLESPLSFTKGIPVMRIPVQSRLANATFCNSFQYGSKLFDLLNDPEQCSAVDNPEIEVKMIKALIEKMEIADAPNEQYQRLGLSKDQKYDETRLHEERKNTITFESFPITSKYEWSDSARRIFIGMLALLGENQVESYFQTICEMMVAEETKRVERSHFEKIARQYYSDDDGKIFYFLNKLERVD